MIDLAINVTKIKDWQIITQELDDYQASKLTQTFNKLINDLENKHIILNLDEVLL